MGDMQWDCDEGEPSSWTVLKTIQEANAASMEAMEEYLLLATGPETLGDHERATELLERSINHHKRIIEHLELATQEIDVQIESD